MVFGTQLAIAQVLAAWGWTINTACVERLNLDLRQRVAALGRRVNTLCQGEAGLQPPLVLFQVSPKELPREAKPFWKGERRSGRGYRCWRATVDGWGWLS